jgi:glutamyl-tRNA reductase
MKNKTLRKPRIYSFDEVEEIRKSDCKRILKHLKGMKEYQEWADALQNFIFNSAINQAIKEIKEMP